MSPGIVRFGILGAARIAPAALIRPAAANPEATVEVVAARDPGRARAYAARHGIPRVAEDYDAVVSDPDIDAVYVPLPNSEHGRWTLTALAAGKHVLCEKPFTANAEEAGRVAEAAREAARSAGLVTAEAFHYRHHPLAQRMQAVVRSGELGRIRDIEAWLCAPIPNRRDIRYQHALAGGAMMDMGCYVVNMVRMLTGAEPTVRSARAKLHDPQVDRAMTAELAFPGGITGTVHCSMWSTSLLHVAARATGTAGTLRVLNPVGPQALSVLRVRSARGRHREVPVRRPTYAFQLDAFCEAVLRGGTLPTTADDAVANMSVIDAVYEAAGLRPRGV